MLIKATKILASLGLLAVGATQKTFEEDGYKITLTGQSGKLKFSAGGDDNTFISISQDAFDEVQTSDGKSIQGVNSWASTDLEWTDDTVKCGEKPSEVAIRFCDTLSDGRSLKVGSNSKNAPTVSEYHVRADLTNASYYHLCGCGASEVATVGDPIPQPFNENYDQNTHGYCASCKSVCVLCSAGSCTAEATDTCTGNLSLSVTPSNTGDICNDTVCVCENFDNVTSCGANNTCSAGTKKLLKVTGTLEMKSDFVEASCKFQPKHQLKFSIKVNGWPWNKEDGSSAIAYSVEVKGSSTGTAPTDDSDCTYKTMDNLCVKSSTWYLRCPEGEGCNLDDMGYPDCADTNETTSCCREEVDVAVSSQGSKDIIKYTFKNSNGAGGICYDPALGSEDSDSPNASTRAIPSILCLLLAMASFIFF